MSMPMPFQQQVSTPVILVSRSGLFRECVACRLAESERFRVAAVFDRLSLALAGAAEVGAEVLLVDGSSLDDRSMKQLGGRRGRRVKVVILGMRRDALHLQRYVDAGVYGYLLRDAPLDELTAVLDAVLRGERVCGGRVAADLLRRLAVLGRRERRQQAMGALSLTPRQMEVLRLIARGMGNEQVADQLGLSPYTVKNHVHNILDRLGVSDRTEAVAFAYRRRWLL